MRLHRLLPLALTSLLLLSRSSHQSPAAAAIKGNLIRRAPPAALTHNADLGAILGKAVYASRCVGEACIVRVPEKTGNAVADGFRKMGKWLVKQKQSFVREATKPTPAAKQRELRRLRSGRELATQTPHSPTSEHLSITDQPRRHSSAEHDMASASHQQVSPDRVIEPIEPPRASAADAAEEVQRHVPEPAVTHPAQVPVAINKEEPISVPVSPEAGPSLPSSSEEIKSHVPFESTEVREKIDSTNGLGEDAPSSPHRPVSPQTPSSPRSPLLPTSPHEALPNGYVRHFPEIEVSSSPETSPTSARPLISWPEAGPSHSGRADPYAISGLEEAKDIGVHLDKKGVVHLYNKEMSPDGPPHLLKKKKSLKAKIKNVLYKPGQKGQPPATVIPYRASNGHIYLVPTSVDASALITTQSAPARPALTRANSVHLTGQDANNFVGDLLTGDQQPSLAHHRSKSVNDAAMHKSALRSPESAKSSTNRRVVFRSK